MRAALTAAQCRKAAAFHRSAAATLTYYGKHSAARLARAMAYLCTMRAARMERA